MDTKNLNNFDAISIRIASPEQIKNWAKQASCKKRASKIWPCPMMGECNCAEVRKPETINYRTFRPEREGLFCEAIFGPQKDWECACGKYKRIKHKGVICDRCGVEVTQQKVRRERMGYIQLAAPVSHVWYFKGLPSRIGLFLDLSFRDIERILYFEAYVVLDVNDSECPLTVKQLLSEEEYNKCKMQQYKFRAGMGAEAIRELLERIDLEQEAKVLRAELEETGSKQKARKLSKRLKSVLGFLKSGNKPHWMILTEIPVIPPDLRPLVALDGGRFATSDLNDLYRRVINRNNRLKRLMELRAPEVIIRNEKRMLQEAVDALLDNGRHGRIVRGPGNRPLKSLSDMLKGKVGRFRQNLLGKRVDYSGRSVIVVGPELKLHQCGLPKAMALELFKPFIIRKLQEKGYAHTIKRAKNMAEEVSPEVWEVLEEVIDEHPVLLNRPPTLHRLGIQAFQPSLVEGKAIRINPLVCTAFNADFDGDQMAVHVPLSVEAQVESKLLMMATRNILKPAHGEATAVPNLDVVLGCSFLTKSIPQANRESACRIATPRHYQNQQEVILAHECGILGLHDPILLHIDDAIPPIETTVGRVIFNQIIPNDLMFTNPQVDRQISFINWEMQAKDLSRLVSRCFDELGNRRTVEFIDELKQLGFHYATVAGVSIGIGDLIVPSKKQESIQAARAQVTEIDKEYVSGGMSPGERYNKVIDVWHQLIDDIETALFEELEQGRDDEIKGFNPVHIMVDSGARSRKESIRQISGMRGLMTKPSGEIIEQPIESSFREGLSVLEYFISTHGARKGLADTAIKTASSGYLTRKLVDVAQDMMITTKNCGTLNGITKVASEDEDDTFSERITGRTVAEDITDPNTDEIIIAKDMLISRQIAEQIEAVGVTSLRLRSALTCEAAHGVCALCYGTDLTTGQLVDIGEAIGIIAAQSIGEPGTQLTMRTFHTGGTVSGGGFQSRIEARHDGVVKYHNVRFVEHPVQVDESSLDKSTTKGEPEIEKIVLSRNAQLRIVDDNGRVIERHDAQIGARLCVDEGQKVTKGDPHAEDLPPTLLLEWDPYRVPILTEYRGKAVFQDIVEGRTMREDKATGLAERVIIEYKGEDQPRIEIYSDNEELLASYLMPTGAHLSVTDDSMVTPGTVLARLPRETAKSRDIVTGLPRVTELFEARRPREAAIIAEIEGHVKLEGINRGMRQLRIVHTDVSSRPYRIPMGKHLIVHDGDLVEAGERVTDGPINPHDILEVKGEEAVQSYLVNEVQEVYRTQGERINDKHIEVIIRRMLNKVRITSSGSTEFLEDDEVDRSTFNRVNRRAIGEGGQPAMAEPILQGITKAALSTESFISAASFQQTTNVLTKATVVGKRDYLKGLKENVIMGRLIPAGTGVSQFRKIEILPRNEPESPLPKSDLSILSLDEQAAD